MKKIAVIGGGGTGHTLAADLSRRGFDVSLCEEPQYRKSLSAARDAGGIEISGVLEPGFVELNSIDADFDDSVAGANIVLVAVVANRHAELARRIYPRLIGGQSILIGPDNGGALVFAREFRALGMDQKVLLGGMGGNYYACRLTGPAKVYVGLPTGPKTVAAFPATDTPELIASLDGLFELTAATNVLETALSTPNIPNHLAGAILNAGAVETSGGTFNLFRDGLSPAVLRCIDAVAAERNAVLKALGYKEINSPMLHKIAQLDQHPELNAFRDLGGPSNMQHRYLTEDAQSGISLLVSLGELLETDTPVARGLLAIASAISGTDCYANGRTIYTLGLECQTVGDINRFLETGSPCNPVDVPPLM